MDAQVNPWVAALIVILSVAIFGVKFWADGEKAHVPAPTFVRAVPDGGFWLVMDKELMHFDAQGRYQDRIYSIASPGKPEDCSIKGLCCGFVKVKKPLAAGSKLALKDARRTIQVRIEDDIRPDRTARKALKEML